MRLVLVGVGVGLGVGWWRALPPASGTGLVAWWVIGLVAVGVAFFAGYLRRSPVSASAVAVAVAESSSTATNAVVVNILNGQEAVSREWVSVDATADRYGVLDAGSGSVEVPAITGEVLDTSDGDPFGLARVSGAARQP